MTGQEVIELIQNSCDLNSELVIQVEADGEPRKFFKIVRTDEAFMPKKSDYAATLVGWATQQGEIV